jgi:hypothetical protein
LLELARGALGPGGLRTGSNYRIGLALTALVCKSKERTDTERPRSTQAGVHAWGSIRHAFFNAHAHPGEERQIFEGPTNYFNSTELKKGVKIVTLNLPQTLFSSFTLFFEVGYTDGFREIPHPSSVDGVPWIMTPSPPAAKPRRGLIRGSDIGFR